MLSPLMPWLVGWIALVAVLAALFVYHHLLADREDHFVHVLHPEASTISHQTDDARRIEGVERWMRLLGVVCGVYGLALAGVYIYQAWISIY